MTIHTSDFALVVGTLTLGQGCSLGLERLGLATFFWNISSRLGLEAITSWSRSRDFGLVNMHAMRICHEENNGSDPQETRCQVRDFTSWCF